MSRQSRIRCAVDPGNWSFLPFEAMQSREGGNELAAEILAAGLIEGGAAVMGPGNRRGAGGQLADKERCTKRIRGVAAPVNLGYRNAALRQCAQRDEFRQSLVWRKDSLRRSHAQDQVPFDRKSPVSPGRVESIGDPGEANRKTIERADRHLAQALRT